MKKIIQEGALKGRKEFYALDIGAGNFQWGKGLADFIDKQTDLPKDIKVHITNVRGERNLGKRTIETDRCKIYNLGAFKVEEIFEQFKEQGLDLEGKIDLAVSHWCFRHLVDPVGTALQVCQLLRRNGFFFVDGFFFLRNQEKMSDNRGNEAMTQLFLDMKAPFLTRNIDCVRSLNHFVLRKPGASDCRLPIRYLDVEEIGDNWQVGSQCVTRFQRDPQEEDKEGFRLPSGSTSHGHHLYGDKALFDWLKSNELLHRKEDVWRPLQDKDVHLGTPSLHQALLQNDMIQAKTCLDRGDDLNEIDCRERTPLQIALQNKSLPLFKLLLSKGASPIPLSEMCKLDFSADFVNALIETGANINCNYPNTPLRVAIESKNFKAIEALIKAEAVITNQDRELLENAEFSSLHALLPEKKKEKKHGYAEVSHWISSGDCVILHYNGSDGMKYYYPIASNPNPRLISVNINPNVKLLDDGEWPDYLRIDGFVHIPCDDPCKIKGDGFKEFESYSFAYD
jgi:hypothetical protein